jgi:enoyl-CoA hydratase
MSAVETIFHVDKGLGQILLNRPQVLNALSPGQFIALDQHLAEWQHDESVRVVVIEGAGDKAFSAGGDIRAVWDARSRGDDAFNRAIFHTEYCLDRRIHHYPKPYVALMDGIVMGGGAGISVNGRFRVATERTSFAMPEAAIGFFPDVGATHFLSRCPGHIGLYLGLTGTRLGPADALWAGIATHFVPAGELVGLKAELARATGSADSFSATEAVLATAHRDPGPAGLAERSAAIDRCFAKPSVADVITALREEGAAWSHAALAALAAHSPTSMAIAFRQLKVGRDLSFDLAIRQEYRLACSCLAGDEFYEGIRALVVDKDRRPQWRPAALADMDEPMLDRLFAGCGDELSFKD